MRLHSVSLPPPHRTLKTDAIIPKSYEPKCGWGWHARPTCIIPENYTVMGFSAQSEEWLPLRSHVTLQGKIVQETSTVESVCRTMEFKSLIFHFLMWVQQVALSGNKRYVMTSISVWVWKKQRLALTQQSHKRRKGTVLMQCKFPAYREYAYPLIVNSYFKLNLLRWHCSKP